MYHHAVNWSEGMFLRPHHFQASDRYWDEQIRLQYQLDHPCGYGINAIRISSDALTNGVLEIAGLFARMKDGTLIHYGANQKASVDLKVRLGSLSATDGAVTVYLAVPKYSEGASNVATTSTGVKNQRFNKQIREFPDDCSGENYQEVPTRVVQHQILFSIDDLTGFDVLPIGKLVRNSQGGFVLGNDFYPPCLSIKSWEPLDGLMSELLHFLGSRLRFYGQLFKDRGISLTNQVEGDMEKLWLLQVLNECYGELSCIATAPGIHPLVAYTMLCRSVGKCSIFGVEQTTEEIPAYNHDDIAPIFRWANDQIRRLINSVKDDEMVMRSFRGNSKGMHVILEPEWFGDEWEWFFGVNPINLKIEDCIRVLKELDWKLGATEQVESYMTKSQPGLRLKPPQQLPRVLMSRGGNWLILQIRLDDEPWRHIKSTQTMAMRVRTEQIANLDTLEGSQRLRVAVAGQVHSLEFAIFAVKKRA